MDSGFLSSSQISAKIYNTGVSIKDIMWEVCSSPTLMPRWELFANDRKMVRWAVLGLQQDGVCTDLHENLGVNTGSLKPDLSSNTVPFSTHLFSQWSIVNTSVADPDPDPDPSDSYVFGPPGSGFGSISQMYGSGSFYHQSKIVRKSWFLLLCDFFLTLKYCKCTFKEE